MSLLFLIKQSSISSQNSTIKMLACHYDAAKNVEECILKITNIWKFSSICNNKRPHEIFVFAYNLSDERNVVQQ